MKIYKLRRARKKFLEIMKQETEQEEIKARRLSLQNRSWYQIVYDFIPTAGDLLLIFTGIILLPFYIVAFLLALLVHILKGHQDGATPKNMVRNSL